MGKEKGRENENREAGRRGKKGKERIKWGRGRKKKEKIRGGLYTGHSLSLAVGLNSRTPSP